LQGFRVERAGDFGPVLREAFAASGPVIVDIPIDYRENDKLGIDLWKLAPDLQSWTPPVAT
jgi:thiamine pyrophosphate-dependent acetolactate synthase large subunit-like protein